VREFFVDSPTSVVEILEPVLSTSKLLENAHMPQWKVDVGDSLVRMGLKSGEIGWHDEDVIMTQFADRLQVHMTSFIN
jgi:hypothetical protein